MCFEKRHLHAALEGCDKYLYPRLYIHSKHSKLASTQARHAARPMDSHQSMQTMPRCQWISLWGRYATHSTKMLAPRSLSLSHALPLSLPHQPTPITDIDAKQRRRKMKIEKQAAALVKKKQHQQKKKKYKKKTQKEIQQQRKTLKY